MIETKNVKLLSSEEPILVYTPSASGEGQQIARCPKCQFMVWSSYGDDGDIMCAVRVGTLDAPSEAPPNVHIFTSTKQPWVVLGNELPIKEEYYQREEIWSKASLERRMQYLKALGLM